VTRNATLSEPDREELASMRAAIEVSGVQVNEVVLPQDHHVVLGGMRFHYLEWGNQDKATVVFLHGGGLTAHTFDLTCLSLRPDYHCVALDQRGHGDSEWSPVMDYGFEIQADDVTRFVEHLGLDRVVVAGMSLGGINTMIYAGRRPRQLVAAVLIDVGPELREVGTQRIADFIREPAELDSIEEFIARALDFNPRRDSRLLRRSLTHNLRQTPDGKWTWKYDKRPRFRDDPDARKRRREALWESVDRIDVPTLVIRGAESDVFHDEDAEKLVARLKNGRWAKVPRAGHTVQGDNPAGLVAELRKFFSEIGF
jgi:pimeloyl-ACP methyl ester carboxylesterase